MKKTSKRSKGRPAIPGKAKYTLNLTEASVDAFYETEANLSGFVDANLKAFLKKREGAK